MTQPTPQPTPRPPLTSRFSRDPDMVELVELFVGEMPGRIAMLTDALAEQDYELLAGFAHHMRGSGSGYGFPAITSAGRKVEELARADASRVEDIRASVDDLVDLCRRASAG